MKGTYRCTNVKFCMEDDNQCRAWEYLHGLSRKDGSYGKVLSDALVKVLDSETDLQNPECGEGDAYLLNHHKVPKQELAEKTARIVLAGIKELSGAGIAPQSVVALGGAEKAEQGQDEEVSEDMLAFAFGMDE